SPSACCQWKPRATPPRRRLPRPFDLSLPPTSLRSPNHQSTCQKSSRRDQRSESYLRSDPTKGLRGTVAKLVPAPHKVDLRKPDNTMMLQVVK
ncbi:unnamed protein product, partial [Closterium sp. Naga37s-1]